MEEGKGENVKPIFRDIRRYYCEYCGICRSKKSLITSHMLTHHQELVNKKNSDGNEKMDGIKYYTCEECGADFKKPAYLKQHMQSHSLERPFICAVDDCHASYRRKDHLTRHLLQHQGKLFACPIENCSREFTIQGNMKRHVKEFHDKGCSSPDVKGQKQYICQEAGCGKIFKYESKLRKHEESHVKLDSVEAFCSELGCMKYFTNKECLEAHIQACHQHITCEICGSRQLRKNIKRHVRTHEVTNSPEKMKCTFKGCQHSFSNKSNLRQHVKAVHHNIRRFACSLCDMRFAYKHVRDKHEKSGYHVYTPGDFVAADEEFRSRPRGGRKRKWPTVEMLTRKRVNAPGGSTGSCLVYED